MLAGLRSGRSAQCTLRGSCSPAGGRESILEGFMTKSSSRRPMRIRRRGRHASPSQAEKMAAQVGKAVPAVVIAGTFVAVPQAHHAVDASARPTTIAAQGHEVHADLQAGRVEAATLDSIVTSAVPASEGSAATSGTAGFALNASSRWLPRFPERMPQGTAGTYAGGDTNPPPQPDSSSRPDFHASPPTFSWSPGAF